MIRKFTLSIVLLFTFLITKAQLPNGTVVENFTATDINGNEHTLYDYLDAGKTVYIDVFATWCGPCWNYHNTHAFNNFYEEFGPDGWDTAIMFGVEGSGSTSVADILGTGNNTFGDWTEGVDYPIFNNSFVAQNVLDIAFYPTVYKICPIEKKAYSIGQQQPSGLENELLESGCTNPFFRISAATNNFSGCQTSDASFDFMIESPFNDMGEITLTVEGLPNGVQVDFAEETVTQPGENTLTVSNLSNLSIGEYTFEIVATSDFREWKYEVTLVIVEPEITETAPMLPLNGSFLETQKPDFVWENVSSATVYDVQVSDSPNFDSQLTFESEATTNEYTWPFLLPQGKVWYWRVKARNSCLESEYTERSFFQTPITTCTAYDTDDIPVGISTTTVDEVMSVLTLEEEISMENLEIQLQMNHTWVGDLAAYLVAPDQTVYTLFDRPGVPASTFGCSFNNLILTFSPSASSTAVDLENTCNPNIALSGIFQPIDDYTTYSGPTEGNWTLIVNDAFEGDGGAIEFWNMNACEPVDVSENLLKINNELIQIPMGGQEPIPTNDLLYEATEGTAADVVYVLTSLPSKGDLLLNGTGLAQWQHFTQSDINNGNLVYQNNGVDAGEDAFQFNAENLLNAGWQPNQIFEIQIVENSMAGSANLISEIDCFGNATGTIEAQISGGNGNLQYSINGVDFQNDAQFAGLNAGNYTITVQDEVGFLFATNEVNLTQPAEIQLNVTTIDFDFSVDATGGTGVFTYSLDGDNYQNSPEFIAPVNGNYTVFVKDENDCIASKNVIIAVNTLVASANILTEIACFDDANGAIEVQVGGGTPPLQYSLDGQNFQDEAVFAELSAGTYQATIMDAEGFTQTTDMLVLNNPTQLEMDVMTLDFFIEILASGGTGDLQYSLNGVDFQSSNEFTAPANGDFTITAMDENGCTTTSEVNIAVNTMVISWQINSMDCYEVNNGEIVVNINGGTAPFTYALNGGDAQNEPTFSDLAAGIYQIEVLDSEGFAILTDEIEITSPAEIIADASVFFNQVSVTASGGTGNLQYSLDGQNFQIAPTFLDLPNGDFIIIVMDENGCQSTINGNVNIVLAASTAVNMVSCLDGEDGVIEITEVEGGEAPYQYSINEGTPQADPIFMDLEAGIYDISIVDANNFEFLISAEITNPAAIEASAEVVDEDIVVTAFGGTGMLVYSLDGVDFQAENVFLDVPSGNYDVVVKDENDCTQTVSIVINSIFNNSLTISKLNVFPNPTNGFVNLGFLAVTGKEIQLTITDFTGRIVLEKRLEKSTIEFSTQLDLSALASGLYVVSLTDGEFFGVGKVTKK